RQPETVRGAPANQLMAAENEAEDLRRTTEQEAQQRNENAAREVDEKLAAATAKARATVEEGQRRRTAIESQITELEAMRDRVLSDLERIDKELETTVSAHRARTSADLLGTLAGKGDRAKRERERQPRATEAERPAS